MLPIGSEHDEVLASVVERTFRAHAAQLYRYIYSKVGHVALAEDLTSEVFLKAFRWLQQERSPHSVRGWLYATARTTISDHWQRQQRLSLLPLDDAQNLLPARDVPSGGGESQAQARVLRLLSLLPPRERTVLTLRYLRGYTAAETGAALGLTPSHVRVVQVRALRLAATLEAEERSTTVQTQEDGFTEQVRHALVVARDEAAAFDHDFIGTEHLLLGLMRDDRSIAATVLADLGMTAERVRGGVLFFMGRGPHVGAPGGAPELTPRAQTALTLAADEARSLGDPSVGTEHALLGLMREGDGLAAGMLQMLGVTMERLREQTMRVWSSDLSASETAPQQRHAG